MALQGSVNRPSFRALGQAALHSHSRQSDMDDAYESRPCGPCITDRATSTPVAVKKQRKWNSSCGTNNLNFDTRPLQTDRITLSGLSPHLAPKSLSDSPDGALGSSPDCVSPANNPSYDSWVRTSSRLQRVTTKVSRPSLPRVRAKDVVRLAPGKRPKRHVFAQSPYRQKRKKAPRLGGGEPLTVRPC